MWKSVEQLAALGMTSSRGVTVPVMVGHVPSETEPVEFVEVAGLMSALEPMPVVLETVLPLESVRVVVLPLVPSGLRFANRLRCPWWSKLKPKPRLLEATLGG
ncbi:hypothetical protein BBO99_00004432 [Phytophthora kernoviae]|uniref:Uncharacterized protein n=2 Tax=Phytophthora kernoviae TaxID=325452 RepID=A0A3R7J445_9STRA|nr:hypothetical protein G195_006753 [Phytophthora kernoviae 00238/432]KAG2524518.1 hypothetical protein JM16_004886 [Phytophthora kernoviae]KAG2526212.1 hypothetical protein JM18_004461 [Phytophthora kernoviae]RLN20146.1 hypothetical protein BBI17_004895 [Phytophthora kernoviae]RLN80516.1 hypothetical protein BBO99_00004432 [Phytophthora kernoviae]